MPVQCPVPYDPMLRFKQQRFNLRLRMGQWALREGLKAAARVFGASRNTVRTWVRRYQLHGLAGLADHSRAPHRIPHQTPPSARGAGGGLAAGPAHLGR